MLWPGVVVVRHRAALGRGTRKQCIELCLRLYYYPCAGRQLSALGGGLWLADLIPVCRRVSDRWVIHTAGIDS
eukprot:COSAG01_NODE_4377_length_5085_cov_6.039110_1_plen_72_part_10